MAKQTLENGDSGLLARQKINSNDTELYDRDDTPVSNDTEFLYIKGNATTDDSLRYSVDDTTGNIKAEKRVSGTWERTYTEKRATDFNILAALSDYKAGRLSYDPDCKCHLSDTGFSNVRVNLGRETHLLAYNNTASEISNGLPASVDLTFTGGLPNICPIDNSDINSVLGFAGVATMDIPAGESGVVTTYGIVRGVDTSSLTTGFIYATTAGGYTQTRPVYPLERLLIGAVAVSDDEDGIILVAPQYIPRRSASRSYSFSSADAAAGTHYRAGFYDWSSTSVTLNQGSTTVDYGTANLSRAAHVGVVPSAAGTVNTGQVGLRVTGTLDSETGIQVASQTKIITEDITTLTANTMKECVEKFSGEVTIELYVVSGTPTAYSLTFNYGFSKYEDFANIDGTVIAFSAVWEAGATDTSFDVALRHHSSDNWTYAASGFEPGDGDICRRSVDQAVSSNLALGVAGAYKRVNLNQFINGSGTEGVIIEVSTGSTKTIRNMDLHVSAYSEELS